MAINEVLNRLFVLVNEINDRVMDLESEHGDVTGFHFATSFPASPYPNQIIVRVDQSPPQGGVMYRYDQASTSWRRLSN